MKKMYFSDTHNHLSHVNSLDFCNEEYICCSSFHTKEEFESFQNQQNVLKSFGVHPQKPDQSLLEYVAGLAKESKIDAVGECGFDLFNDEFKQTLDMQVKCFDFQVNVAAEFRLPLVIHIRKAMNLIFERCRGLKRVPSLIFHSFPGTLIEAESLMKKGLNCYFSFGKPLLNGKKSALECVSKLPVERILLETDAPYQTLKNEKFTELSDIVKIYHKVCELRNVSMENLKSQVLTNFERGFLIH